MPFCSNCGKALADDAKFCAGCGTAVNLISDGSQRIQKFSGEIKKCPNCGAMLPSGVLKCPECDYEIRDAQASNAAIDFFNKINSAQSEQQKIEIIKKYPIPNTREDIKEFLNRAKAEVEADYNADDYLQDQLHEAWIVCFNNIKNRVKAMPQSDRNEFLEIIDDTAVNIFKIKITKTKNLKNRVDLIKVYPIETTSKNLMSLVTFIDSQIEYKSHFSVAFLLLASFFTFFIPLLAYFVKNKIETGVFLDYTTSLNKAYFFRLKEIKNQITFLAEEPDVKEKVNSYVKSIYRKRAINTFYSIFVTIFITIPAISLIYACRSC